MTRRCASCGTFVPNRHLATVWHAYDIDPTKPVAVYSEATATRLLTRLDCRSCSMSDALLREAKRGHGIAVGRHLPNGWETCAATATQDDYANHQGDPVTEMTPEPPLCEDLFGEPTPEPTTTEEGQA